MVHRVPQGDLGLNVVDHGVHAGNRKGGRVDLLAEDV